MADKTKVAITILVAIIIILAAAVTYAFVIRPKISGYVNLGYNVGYQKAFLEIMQGAATCQTVPLTYGNQTINIIAVECIQ